MDTTDEMWDSFDVFPQEYIEVGDKVVVANRVVGTGRSSGVETQMVLFAVVSFRDGKILRYAGGFRTRAEALEAARAPDE
jgi:hypothetical protein